MYSIWPVNLSEEKTDKGTRQKYLVEQEILEVEPGVLKHLRSKGFEGIFSANETWWKISFLLFYDQIYFPLEGVFDPEFGEFPNQMQDIPKDLFEPSFYKKRSSHFENRFQELEHKGILNELIRGIEIHKDSPSRILQGLDKNIGSKIQLVGQNLKPHSVLAICKRLLSDFRENRRGLPDLFLLKKGNPILAEVKSPRDMLSQEQIIWLNYIERIAKIETALIVVNHPDSQINRLKGKKKVKEKPITIRFSKSSSSKYGEAIECAKSFPTYRELGSKSKIPNHEVTIDTEKVSELLCMVDLVYRWKGTEIFFEGKKITSSDLRLPLNCYREKVNSSAGNSWCKMDPYTNEGNLCGCRNVFLEGFNTGRKSWTDLGYIDSDTHEFILRKDKIKEEVFPQFEGLKLCPVFDEKKAIRAMESMPERVNPEKNKGWAYEVDGVKWFPTTKGWINEWGDGDFPGLGHITGAAQFSNKELREAQSQLRERQRQEREWERLDRPVSTITKKAKKSGCMALTFALLTLVGTIIFLFLFMV